MQILLTGATSNIARGLIPRLVDAGHTLVLSDIVTAPDAELFAGHPYVQCDVQIGIGLEGAARDCDTIVHLPAWHGIHCGVRTEVDFWRLNIDGTFWMFQAAQAAGVARVLFLSSQAWHGHYHKYGFTKRIGEELCEYNRREHGIAYVAVRPNDLTPWHNFVHHYGLRFLYIGVDREDVLDSVVKSLAWLEQPEVDGEAKGGYVDAVRYDPYTEEDLVGWEEDPAVALERIFPNSRELVSRYEMDLSRRPLVSGRTEGDLAETIGFRPRHHFGSFLDELRRLDVDIGREAVLNLTCPYATP